MSYKRMVTCWFSNYVELEDFIEFIEPVLYEYCSQHPGFAYSLDNYLSGGNYCLDIKIYKY